MFFGLTLALLALLLKEVPAECPLMVLQCPPLATRGTPAGKKQGFMIFSQPWSTCVWFPFSRQRFTCWVVLYLIVSEEENYDYKHEKNLAYLQQSVSNMDPCFFWRASFIYSGDKNALRGNKHISLNESRKRGIFLYYWMAAAASHQLHLHTVARDWAMLALLQQHLLHRGLCKAESPSHQQCWFPNYPSGQTL